MDDLISSILSRPKSVLFCVFVFGIFSSPIVFLTIKPL